MKNLGKEVTDKYTVKNEEFGRRSERRRLYRDGTGRHIHGIGGGFRDGRRFNQGEDRGKGLHINNGRRDGIGPHHDVEGCNTNPTKETSPEDRGYRFYKERFHRPFYTERNIETKLFTSKDELVKYVNDRKADNSNIEIFKIEDGLYKLVIRS
jgi:hypothetical protein